VQKLWLQASGVLTFCVTNSHNQMGHFSDSPSVLPSDMLAAGDAVVEDAASPSLIMFS
jgi:hypothetical protein